MKDKYAEAYNRGFDSRDDEVHGYCLAIATLQQQVKALQLALNIEYGHSRTLEIRMEEMEKR